MAKVAVMTFSLFLWAILTYTLILLMQIDNISAVHQHFSRINQQIASSHNQAQLVRIVNGLNATENAWKYMVSLFVSFNSTQYGGRKMTSLCGGTALNQFTILSAAHCFAISDPLVSVKAFIGSHTFRKGVELDVNLTNLIVHPEYNETTFKNDITLILLDQPLPEQHRTYARLPPSKQLPELLHDDCVALGWGKLAEDEANAQYLQIVTVPLLSDVTCEQSVDRGEFNRTVMMCAGYLDGSRDACSGDSGGPLLCPSAEEKSVWYQVGITSFGDGCAQKGIPGFYTRVAPFLQWIQLRSKN